METAYQTLFTNAELYDAAAYGADPHALQWLLEHYEVIGMPRQSVTSPIRRGDILLRRAEGGLAHACVIVDPQFRNALEVMLAGGVVEIGSPGNFVFVAERGARPHDEYARFARRITDLGGRVLGRQFVLRPREDEGESGGEGERYGGRGGVDPMSLMVGMSIANMGAARPVTRVEVVAPKAEPLVEWGESGFDADTAGRGRIPPARRSGWPAFSSSPVSERAHAGESFNESEFDTFAEFNSPEHFRLGSNIQKLVDNWAKVGLISGGCFVVDTDANGDVLPLGGWKYFLPDRKNQLQPYGDKKLPEDAHWHSIAPNAHRDANARDWTATSLAADVTLGNAITLSVGDIIMMSGDMVGNFSDYAAASKASWRSSTVNIAEGLRQGDPFAYAVVRRLQFPRSGADARHDVHMLHHAATKPGDARKEVQSTDAMWTLVRAFVDFLKEVRGGKGYREMLVLSRLMRTKKITVSAIRLIAPWVTAKSAGALAGLGLPRGFTLSTPIDSDVFQMIATNGHYGELAMENQKHFSPDNWSEFEKAHRGALELVEKQVPITGVTIEYAPIPADAIAQLAHGMHFLTDAFAAGHMRTPRKKMGRTGGLLAVVMHDFENEFGLIVENGFGHRWRAFGDGSLDNQSTEQKALLTNQYYASKKAGQTIDPRFSANRDRVMNAVQAAMKHLHYQAQRHYGDTKNAAQFQNILRVVRGVTMGLLYDDPHRDSAPGDGAGRDDWIAMDIDAKVRFMRKHQPKVMKVTTDWIKGTGNHPPMAKVDLSGVVVLDSDKNYILDQNLITLGTSSLYLLELSGAPEFRQNIQNYTVLAALMPKYVEAWAGAKETWLLDAINKSWVDNRGRSGDASRAAVGLSGLGLP